MAAPIAIIALNKTLNVQLMNPRCRHYLNIEEEHKGSIVGMSIVDCFSGFREFSAPIVKKLMSGNRDFDLPEIKLGTRFVTVRCRPIAEGGTLLTFMNINKLKEKETSVLNAMMDGQELERRRFAQEIHDGLGPLLSTLKLNIQNLQSNEDLSGQELHDKLQFMVEMVDMMTQDIRSISHALLPPILVDFGLEAALSHICHLANSAGLVKVEFFASKNNTRLNPQTELGLYRITQELLNNAIKYSKATTIALQMFRHPHSLVLTVEDDGVGFNESELKQKMKGIGFQDIQGRVKSMEGQFTLESAPGEGVLAVVEIPLTENKGDQKFGANLMK